MLFLRRTKYKLLESAILDRPFKIEGPIRQAKKAFYDLARTRIKYLTKDEVIEWNQKTSGEDHITNASFIIGTRVEPRIGFIDKWVTVLEIVIFKDGFNLYGIDYSCLIPLAIEHEIYEAWLGAKIGVASNLTEYMKHLLACRREYFLACRAGVGEVLFQYDMACNPNNEAVYRYAWQAAVRRLGRI